MVYDDRCYLCSRFAGAVGLLGGGGLRTAGHHSEAGVRLRREVLGPGALEMFWFVDGRTAYGGRAALLPLLGAIIRGRAGGGGAAGGAPPAAAGGAAGGGAGGSCGTECGDARAVFLRSASLLTHSRTVRIG